VDAASARRLQLGLRCLPHAVQQLQTLLRLALFHTAAHSIRLWSVQLSA